jgi:DNA-binding transcriptional LysR family regulator
MPALPDPESLRCFVEAARLLNFRSAAAAVALTPAALGQRIRRLEDEVGQALFLRSTRRCELTPAGLALLPLAQDALAAADRCVRAARGELAPPPMDLRLGTRHELGMSWVVPMLPALEAAFPFVTFHLYVGSGPDLELRLLGREIDCAVSSRRLADPRVAFEPLQQEDYVMVAAPALLRLRPLRRFEDAAGHTLLDAGRELPLFAYWRDAAGRGLPFARFRSLGTIDAIRSLVLRGEGVAVLPLYLVRGDLAARRLQRVLRHVDPLHDWFRLLFRAEDPRAPLFRALAERMGREPLA